jgi:hypothetical protein
MVDVVAIYEALLCPVCGFQLDFKPWNGDSASDEICPWSGIQFGYDNAGPCGRWGYYNQWRKNWREGGSLWWSKHPCPPNYDPNRKAGNLAKLG